MTRQTVPAVHNSCTDFILTHICQQTVIHSLYKHERDTTRGSSHVLKPAVSKASFHICSHKFNVRSVQDSLIHKSVCVNYFKWFNSNNTFALVFSDYTVSCQNVFLC